MDVKEIVTKIKYFDGGAFLSAADKIPQIVNVKKIKAKVSELQNPENLDGLKSTLRLAKDIAGWVPQWFQSILH